MTQTTMNSDLMTELAQKQLDAYNTGDIKNFCECYHPEVQAFDLLSGAQIISGMTDFEKAYSLRFSQNPLLHCELKNRIVLPTSVLDEEFVTGVEGRSDATRVVAIYGFRDNLIDRVWFAR